MYRVSEGTCINNADPFQGIMVSIVYSPTHDSDISANRALCVDPKDFNGDNDPDI